MDLTDLERETLANALELHLQGLLEARREMEADRATFDNLDDFMDVMGDCGQDIIVIQDIIEKVKHDYRNTERRTTRPLRALLQRLQGHVAARHPGDQCI